jgi:DNA-binding response OmpR family regulator
VKKQAVLLLEDDPNLGMILQEHLEMNGYAVTLAVNGALGLAAYQGRRFDLCLVDVMMPRMDGFTFAREIRREDSDIPLIFLTAKSLKEDRIEGLKIGADDYLTKPFSMEELLLRIHAVLKRTTRNGGGSVVQVFFTLGTYTFDYTSRTLKRKTRERKLTTREADLLRLLCAHVNTTLDRSKALKELWGEDTYFAGRSMDVFISKLRKYLKDDPAVEILNDHGRGVKLVIRNDAS